MSYLDLIHKQEAPESGTGPAIFAATDMKTVIRNGCPSDQDTVHENGKCYRRLTPEYWAWFYHKYLLMEKALTNGKISEATFVEILDRISKLYNLALAAFGNDALHEAERTTDVKEMDALIKIKNRDKNTASTGEPVHTKEMRSRVPSIVAERTK
jgi:hypothetical protein